MRRGIYASAIGSVFHALRWCFSGVRSERSWNRHGDCFGSNERRHTGASVVAINGETGTKYETISTETGNYTLTQLPPGVYQVSVELPGFKKYVRQGINVLVAQTLRIDVAFGSRSGYATKSRLLRTLHC